MNITNFTNKGKCSSCGECCSDFLHLDDKEIKRIDEYLEDHTVGQLNKNPQSAVCPFRDNLLKKCAIYEARPYICRLFKCDTPVNKAIIDRDEVNKDKKVRSMKELFFKDDSTIKLLEELNTKVYRRGE